MVGVALLVVLAQLDGGAAVERKTSSQDVYLGKGNRMGLAPRAVEPNPFLALCRKVADGCAFNRAVWQGEMLLFTLEPDGELRRLKLDRVMSENKGAFSACVRKGLDGQRIPAKDTGPRMACSTRETPHSHVDPQTLIERVTACLDPETPLKQLVVKYAQVVEGRYVKLQDLAVSGDVPVDLETETCVRRAASVPDFEFAADEAPPFTRKENTLTIHTWYPGRPEPELPPGLPERLKSRPK